MRHCGHCGKELMNKDGEPLYDRYFCNNTDCKKADYAERVAVKRAKTRGKIERKIERAIKAHCKRCKENARCTGTVKG